MIPALIFAAVTVGGVFTAAGQSVIKDTKEEIDDINRSSQNMIDETKELIESTNEEAKKAYNGLTRQRTTIYNSSFKKATQITEKIKVSSKASLKNEITEFNENISSVDYSILSSAKLSSGIITGVSVLGGLGGLVVGTIVSGVALEFKKDEALANKEKIRAECEKAKLECTRMQNVTCVMNDSKKTIKALNKLAQKSEERVEEIFADKGYDSSKWSKMEVESVRTMFNFLKALSDLMNVEILTANGNISRKYKKLIGEAEVIVNETA